MNLELGVKRITLVLSVIVGLGAWVCSSASFFDHWYWERERYLAFKERYENIDLFWKTWDASISIWDRNQTLRALAGSPYRGMTFTTRTKEFILHGHEVLPGMDARTLDLPSEALEAAVQKARARGHNNALFDYVYAANFWTKRTPLQLLAFSMIFGLPVGAAALVGVWLLFFLLRWIGHGFVMTTPQSLLAKNVNNSSASVSVCDGHHNTTMEHAERVLIQGETLSQLPDMSCGIAESVPHADQVDAPEVLGVRTMNKPPRTMGGNRWLFVWTSIILPLNVVSGCLGAIVNFQMESLLGLVLVIATMVGLHKRVLWGWYLNFVLLLIMTLNFPFYLHEKAMRDYEFAERAHAVLTKHGHIGPRQPFPGPPQLTIEGFLLPVGIFTTLFLLPSGIYFAKRKYLFISPRRSASLMMKNVGNEAAGYPLPSEDIARDKWGESDIPDARQEIQMEYR